MRFRPQRGSLVTAMKEMREVANRSELLSAVRAELDGWHAFEDDDIKLKPYCGDDDRIGWKNVHLVVVKNWGPAGYVEWGDALQEGTKE